MFAGLPSANEVVGRIFEQDAIQAIGQRPPAGNIGADEISRHRVASGGRLLQDDAMFGVTRDQVSFRRRCPANPILGGRIDLDGGMI